MDAHHISSLQQAPHEGHYKFSQCGFQISLKKGQMVPPCPRCGSGKYEESSAPVPCP